MMNFGKRCNEIWFFVTKSNTVIFGKILVLVCGKYMKTIGNSIGNVIH